MQQALDEPFLHISSDQLVAAGILPTPRENHGPFDWWHELRPRFFAGFHRCLPALATAGNDLIVEHIIEFRSWRDELTLLLADLDVYLVGVHCALDELNRREHTRGDRHIGEARTHIEIDRIHTFGPYDLDVNTTAGLSTELVESILTAWRHRQPPKALRPAPAPA